MTSDFEELKRYLLDLGSHDFPKGRGAFLHHMDHLVGVRAILEKYGCPSHLAIAGLFHSVYSTDEFIGFSLGLDRRPEIRALIGEAAERCVYNYCAVTGRSLFAGALKNSSALWDRFTQGPLAVTEEDFDSLLWMKLANTLDWDGRRGTRTPSPGELSDMLWWRIVAERLGKTAIGAWSEAYGERVERFPYGRRPPSVFSVFSRLFGRRPVGGR